MHELTIETQNFDSDGAYQNTTSLKRFNGLAYFEASPTISMQPPLYEMTVDWDTEDEFDLLPEDVVYQFPLNPGVVDYDVRYWKQYTVENGLAPEFQLRLADLTLFGGNWRFFGAPAGSPILDNDQFYLSLAYEYDITTASNIDYLYYDNPTYISGAYYIGQTIDFKANGVMWFDGDVTASLEAEVFNDRLMYYITITDDEGLERILMSNANTYDTTNVFDWKFSPGSSVKGVNFSIDIKNHPIGISGYLGVKLYPFFKAVSGPTLTRVTYENFNITYNTNNENDSVEKIRTINYTTSESIEVPVGSSRNDQLINKFNISDTVPFTSYDDVRLAEDVEVPVTNYLYTSYTVFNYQTSLNETVYETILYLDEAEYNFISQYREMVYINRAADGSWLKLDSADFYLYKNELRDYVLVSYRETFPILEADALFVRFSAETITLTDPNYLLNTWKRYGITENENWLECLARTYHDVSKNPIKQIEGKAFGLFGPLDLLEFYYLQPVNYQMTRLDLDLSQGTTKTTMTEC